MGFNTDNRAIKNGDRLASGPFIRALAQGQINPVSEYTTNLQLVSTPIKVCIVEMLRMNVIPAFLILGLMDIYAFCTPFQSGVISVRSIIHLTSLVHRGIDAGSKYCEIVLDCDDLVT